MAADCKQLVDSFPKALKNKDKMRGWKRSLTVYCQKQSESSGRPEFRFKAAVKMRLTKAGFNCAAI